MAIITCPKCNNKISDKAKHCPHCAVDMDMDDEQRQVIAERKQAQKMKNLSTHSMMAMVLVLAGTFAMYFDTPEADSIRMRLGQIAFGVGTLWYLINRIRHFMLKSMSKK